MRGMEMENGSNGMKPRTWSAISLGALLIAVAIGLILYWYTRDLLNTFGAILVIFGAYTAAVSFSRTGGEDNFGPSSADAALAGGAVAAGIGAACFVYSATGEVLLTAAAIIIVLAVVGIIMAVKNKDA